MTWDNVSSFDDMANVANSLGAMDHEKWVDCPDTILMECWKALRADARDHDGTAVKILNGVAGSALYQQDWSKAIWSKRLIETGIFKALFDLEPKFNFILQMTNPLFGSVVRSLGINSSEVGEHLEEIVNSGFAKHAPEAKVAGLLNLTGNRWKLSFSDELVPSLSVAHIEARCYFQAGMPEDADETINWLIEKIVGNRNRLSSGERELQCEGLMRLAAQFIDDCQHVEKLLVTALERTDNPSWTGECYYHLSQHYHKQKSFQRAYEAAESAFEILEARKDEDPKLYQLVLMQKQMLATEVTGDPTYLTEAPQSPGAEILNAYGDVLETSKNSQDVSIASLAKLIEVNLSSIDELSDDESNGESIFGLLNHIMKLMCELQRLGAKELVELIEKSDSYKRFASESDLEDRQMFLSALRAQSELVLEHFENEQA